MAGKKSAPTPAPKSGGAKPGMAKPVSSSVPWGGTGKGNSSGTPHP